MTDLGLWLSPHDSYQTVEQLAAASSAVHLPGMATRVLLCTAYGVYLQGSPGMGREIGDVLAPNSLEGLKALRAAIEAQGVPCDGWCVPRGKGDPYQEGYFHGQIAALFDNFYLNFEEWTSTENNPNEQFWTHPTNADAVNAYIKGFWQALSDAGRADALGGHVGLTWVTNSMLTNASDAVKLAFIDGTNFDCLEAYIPGDRSLDPGNAKAIWQATLQRLGRSGRTVVDILEQGDLPSLAQQYADQTGGVQVWTLATAAQQTWPDVAATPQEDPQVIAELQAQVADLQQQLHDMTGSRDSLQGVDNDLGKQLDYVQNLKQQVEATLRAQVADLQKQLADAQAALKTAQDADTADEAQIASLKAAQDSSTQAAQTLATLKAALETVLK